LKNHSENFHKLQPGSNRFYRYSLPKSIKPSVRETSHATLPGNWGKAPQQYGDAGYDKNG
jgi:hypothetical protein